MKASGPKGVGFGRRSFIQHSSSALGAPALFPAIVQPQGASQTMKPFLIARMALTLGATLLIAIVVLSLVPAHDRPITALPHSLEHLTIFFAAGLALGTGYPQGQRFQFAALLVFTAVIEMAQLAVPGRHARLIDFVVDAVAIMTGLSLGLIASPKLLSRPLPPGE